MSSIYLTEYNARDVAASAHNLYLEIEKKFDSDFARTFVLEYFSQGGRNG